MLKDLDLDRQLTREHYRRHFPRLRESLRRLQYELRDAEIPTLVVIEGWGGAGKGEVIQRLAEGLDPRLFRAYPETPPSELETRYHWLWRYQIRLPEDGQLALFDQAWYGRVLRDRALKAVAKSVWKPAYDQINQFERWLTDDGQLIVKIFLHISRKEQERRLVRMKKDPLERWKVDEEDWKQNRGYDRWVKAADDMLTLTHTRPAPWVVVPATDMRAARVAVLRTLVDAMTRALARRKKTPASVSRSRLAAAATRPARERAAKASLARVRATAKEAGLPLPNGSRAKKTPKKAKRRTS